MRSRIKVFWFKFRRLFLTILKPLLTGRVCIDVSQRHEIRKILFIRIDRIGDLVLSTPALKALKSAFAGSSLTVLASRVNYPILINNPYVDDVIVQDSSASLLQQIISARRLRKRYFDLVIDPLTGYDLKPAVIAYLTKAALRIGYPGYGREVFFNVVAPSIDAKRHFIDLVSELTTLIGADIEDRLPQIFLDQAELDRACRWIKGQKSNGKKLVGIHPGGYYETQRWPVEYYAELATALHRQGGCFVIIFGGPHDSELIESLARRTIGHFAVFLDPDLRKTAAVISLLDVLVCNNSGPLHMAGAVDIPTVSFMGPTDVNRWLPRGRNSLVLRKDDLECIGCNNGRCAKRDLACMRLIPPGMAFDAVMKLLQSRRARIN
jgi:lipopolysaccharide heptosyltransferase II